MVHTAVGISSIGLSIPKTALLLSELASLRQVDPAKYAIGLGCHSMALCLNEESIVSLAVQAAQRALSHWQKPKTNIGLVVVATESSHDLSCPLSAWILKALGMQGKIRSYEVKHACYGMTLAIRQAIEWQVATQTTQAALVIGVDQALYAPACSGEPTQGAGSVALIIERNPSIAEIHLTSYPYSEPAFDFWRPIQDSYPQFNAQLSLACYLKATLACFTAFEQHAGLRLQQLLTEYKYLSFHCPFPKMVNKAIQHLGQQLHWTAEETHALYQNKVLPTLDWNQMIGNAYTASLWFAVAKALSIAQPNDYLIAFSYGSGYGAELLTLKTCNVQHHPWQHDIQQDLQQRQYLSKEDYANWRSKNKQNTY